MKVIVKANMHRGLELTVFTPPLRWDVRKQQFVMNQEIGDGIYDFPVRCTTLPLMLSFGDQDLHVLVPTAEDVAALVSALSDVSEKCRESYSTSRV